MEVRYAYFGEYKFFIDNVHVINVESVSTTRNSFCGFIKI